MDKVDSAFEQGWKCGYKYAKSGKEAYVSKSASDEYRKGYRVGYNDGFVDRRAENTRYDEHEHEFDPDCCK